MEPETPDSQSPATGSELAPPHITGVDNDNCTKRFKLGNEMQLIRIFGESFSNNVRVELSCSTGNFHWVPPTRNARSTGDGTRIVVRAKPMSRQASDKSPKNIEIDDLTVTVTNESGDTHEHPEMVEYEP